MKIILGADHKGFALKEKIKKYLSFLGHEIIDVGTFSEERTDYPDFAFKVAESVAEGKSDKGILICWTGNGMTISANKVKGIRAALVMNKEMAKLSREHNDANILCLPSMFVSFDQVEEIVEVWLNTEFEGGRHQKRLEKIKEYEQSQGK